MAEHEGEVSRRLMTRLMPQRTESRRHDEATPSASKSATWLPPSGAGRSVLRLQRQYGNRYVQRVVARATSADHEGDALHDVERAIESTRGGGQSLDRGVQSQMGGALSGDFSGVRVHTDAHADGLNQSLQAKAFTVGQDIYFRQGAYQPGSSTGRELLAHELTHVMQQNPRTVQAKPDGEGAGAGCTCGSTAAPAAQMKLSVSQPGDQYEKEADRVAAAVMHQEAQSSAPASPATSVQRQMPEEEDKDKVLRPKYRDDRSELDSDRLGAGGAR
jgi:uncharacterized protein DUF4157